MSTTLIQIYANNCLLSLHCHDMNWTAFFISMAHWVFRSWNSRICESILLYRSWYRVVCLHWKFPSSRLTCWRGKCREPMLVMGLQQLQANIPDADSEMARPHHLSREEKSGFATGVSCWLRVTTTTALDEHTRPLLSRIGQMGIICDLPWNFVEHMRLENALRVCFCRLCGLWRYRHITTAILSDSVERNW